MTDPYGKFELSKVGESVILEELQNMEIHVIDLMFQGRPSVIAAFLVVGKEGSILIETGPESTKHTLLRALEERGIAPRSLRAVFVTHIHLDHAGAAGWFAAEGVPLFVHPKGAKHLIDPSKLMESARSVYGDQFDELWGGMVPAPGPLVTAMEDGDSVEIAGIKITALETPGHAFHHHAFLLSGDVFAGDAAGARLGENAYTSVTSAPPQFDLDCTLASIEKLSRHVKGRLYLTHFGAVPDPRTHLAGYRDAVELNAEFVRQRIDEGFDAESLGVAYEAFQLEQAFRLGLPTALWDNFQAINGTGMCADGLRRYWERRVPPESSVAIRPGLR